MIQVGNTIFETRIWDGAADADELAQTIEKDPAYDYVRPLQAALARGVMVATVAPFCGPFEIPKDRQAVVWLCDDLSAGPAAFCQASIADFIRRCEGEAILFSSKQPAKVAALADVSAALGRLESVLLIETTPEHSASWQSIVRRISPRVDGSHRFVKGGE